MKASIMGKKNIHNLNIRLLSKKNHSAVFELHLLSLHTNKSSKFTSIVPNPSATLQPDVRKGVFEPMVIYKINQFTRFVNWNEV